MQIYNFPTDAIQLVGVGALIVVISAFFFQSAERAVEDRVKRSGSDRIKDFMSFTYARYETQLSMAFANK